MRKLFTIATTATLLAAGSASAQYPYGAVQPGAVQPGAVQGPVGGPVYGAPYGGQVVGAPVVGGQVVGGQVVGGQVVGGQVVGGGQVIGGPVLHAGGGQIVGGDIPWGENYGSGPQGLGYPGVISNGGGDEQLYPYDQQDPWIHGYFQEIPAYGGYAHFRPYNWRHVLSQTQTAAGWGLSRTMPYSHQYWQHYHERAALEHCPLPYRAYDQYERPEEDDGRPYRGPRR